MQDEIDRLYSVINGNKIKISKQKDQIDSLIRSQNDVKKHTSTLEKQRDYYKYMYEFLQHINSDSSSSESGESNDKYKKLIKKQNELYTGQSKRNPTNTSLLAPDHGCANNNSFQRPRATRRLPSISKSRVGAEKPSRPHIRRCSR